MALQVTPFIVPAKPDISSSLQVKSQSTQEKFRHVNKQFSERVSVNTSSISQLTVNIFVNSRLSVSLIQTLSFPSPLLTSTTNRKRFYYITNSYYNSAATQLSYCDPQCALCSFVGVPVNSRGNRNLKKLKKVNYVHKCKPTKTLENCDITNIYNFIQWKWNRMSNGLMYYSWQNLKDWNEQNCQNQRG